MYISTKLDPSAPAHRTSGDMAQTSANMLEQRGSREEDTKVAKTDEQPAAAAMIEVTPIKPATRGLFGRMFADMTMAIDALVDFIDGDGEDSLSAAPSPPSEADEARTAELIRQLYAQKKKDEQNANAESQSAGPSDVQIVVETPSKSEVPVALVTSSTKAAT